MNNKDEQESSFQITNYVTIKEDKAYKYLENEKAAISNAFKFNLDATQL